MRLVHEAIARNGRKIRLEEEACYLKPTVYQDDEALNIQNEYHESADLRRVNIWCVRKHM